jgi:hypothetical protein
VIGSDCATDALKQQIARRCLYASGSNHWIEWPKELADERFGNRPVAKLAGEAVDRHLRIGVRPVIANPVAVAEVPL